MFRRDVATFKFKKANQPGTRRFELHRQAQATLGAGRLTDAVKLPPGEDIFDWIAVNATDFFNEVSLLYGVLNDVCTPSCCPTMSAGPRFEYKWADGVRIKKPMRCSAPKYIDYMLSWAQTTLDDETIFPIRVGEPFPPNIREVLCSIFKRLFRVYAHIYVLHFVSMQEMGAEPHLNTCFRHFILFVREFDLIAPQELAPLRDLIDKIHARADNPAADDEAPNSTTTEPAVAASRRASVEATHSAALKVAQSA